MRVLLTATFRARLQQLASHFEARETPHEYNRLLEDLESVIIPSLARFPGVGPRLLDAPPQSTESVLARGRLPAEAPSLLRKYVHDDFVILYAAPPEALHLLSVRHHREPPFSP